MSNPTTPFNWQMPTNTDLVTDLPADFEVFGQAVATSMADLLGGTSGQILSKATNADMDFTWINNDQGDITGITATSPLTGGGTSGAITVGIQSASTSQSGAVQLSDSTSTTSSVLAATPTAVKAAKDAADAAQTTATAAIPKSTVTTAGDVIYATGSGAVTRLGIGTAGQVLKVNSGATAPEWGTAAASSGLTLITSQAFTTSTAVNVNSVFSSTYYNYKIMIRVTTGTAGGDSSITMRLRSSGTDATTNYSCARGYFYNTTVGADTGSSWLPVDINSSDQVQYGLIELFNPAVAIKTSGWSFTPKTNSTGINIGITNSLQHTTAASYDGFSLIPGSGNITGTVEVYGYAK
jgi:hypothetical protein